MLNGLVANDGMLMVDGNRGRVWRTDSPEREDMRSLVFWKPKKYYLIIIAHRMHLQESNIQTLSSDIMSNLRVRKNYLIIIAKILNLFLNDLK